ncbi:MAG: hypothetical protein LBB78_03545 [Spirochaetaceae bacterium]|nr:hypothetical protein [Spirochaetaceae bacterium]
MPHKKSYLKGTVPQNKNLTPLCLSGGGTGGDCRSSDPPGLLLDRCGKILALLIRDQISFFGDWPPFRITADIKDNLLRISPAAIDRALKGDRKQPALTGKKRHQAGKPPEKAHLLPNLLPLE